MPQGRRAKKVIDERKRAQRALAGQRNLLASHALSRLPYGIMRYDVDEISPESALFYYKRDQVLWLRLGPAHRKKCDAFGMSVLQTLQAQLPALFQSHWSVENPGDNAKQSLTPEALFAPSAPPPRPFYVSSILQKDSKSLKRFFAKVPFAEAPLLQQINAKHDDGVWLFVGSNKSEPKSKGKSKRKQEESNVLRGRPEHTDAVDHSGTWHVQLQGSKTWFVRPCSEAADWESAPPELAVGKEGVIEQGRGGARLCIDCSAGDLLLINTRAWWHRTEINVQEGSGLSVSYARDFYLDGRAPGKGAVAAGCTTDDADIKTNDSTLDPRMLARKVFKAGDVVLEEDELPDDDLPRAADPNCSMTELDDGSEALVALRRIRKDEPLTLGLGDESDADGYELWELDPETGEMLHVEEDA